MPERYTFGRIEVVPAQRELRVDGRPTALHARAFDVLLALIQRRDRIVSKRELIDTVWSASTVEEQNVVVQVSSLRKLLGDNVIATIPGRGYQWVAPDTGEANAAPAAPSRLSKPTVPLFGRDNDCATLLELMHQHRLVTIVGPGGVGKSRLALEYLDSARRSGLHDTVWVDLGSVAEPSQVVGTLTSALKLSTESGAPLETLLHLQPRSGVVVLDNTEHVVEETARVARMLLEHAPGLRVLTTGRRPLELTAEHLLRLGPLSVPPDGTDAQQALHFGAVAMFVHRAQARERRFELDAASVAHVISICRRLEGLPLAIELAAARVPLFGIAGLDAALSDHLRVLTGGARDAPSRQRTLLDSLEWSHRLLTREQQVVYRRLGVFAGSFSLQMACRVVGGLPSGGADPIHTIDAMVDLVDHSLVQADHAEPPRYSMLQTMRSHALSHLSSAGEDAQTRRLHADAVLAHFEQVYARRWAGQLSAQQALQQLSPELGNAREALAFALAHAPEMAVALVPSLSFALRSHGGAETAQLLELTAAHVHQVTPARLRAAWLVEAARFCAGRMPIESALHGQAATSLYRELGDRVGLFRSLVTVTISDFSHLSAAQREAWREAQSLEDPGWPACLKLILVWARARVQRIDGEYEQSLASLREVIQLARADGDPGIEARALAHVAEMEFIVGEPALASQHALALAARMRNARLYGELPALLRIAAAAQLNQGDVEGARQAAVEGWPLARRGGAESAWFDVLALLAAAEGRADTAARLIGAADADHAARRSARDLIAAASLRDAERRVGDVLGPDLLQHLRSEGSGMWLEEIERMAFARA